MCGAGVWAGGLLGGAWRGWVWACCGGPPGHPAWPSGHTMRGPSLARCRGLGCGLHVFPTQRGAHSSSGLQARSWTLGKPSLPLPVPTASGPRRTPSLPAPPLGGLDACPSLPSPCPGRSDGAPGPCDSPPVSRLQLPLRSVREASWLTTQV